MHDKQTTETFDIPTPEKRYNREEAAAFLQEIARRLVSSEDASLHSMLAINQLLRSPGIEMVLDGDLREQARDLWLKIKSTGIHLNDPPLLFGAVSSHSGSEATPDA